MKLYLLSIMAGIVCSLVRLRPGRAGRLLLANERAPETEAEIFSFANQQLPDDAGWVQLAPYGDFPNVDAKGREIIQRFQRADADAIVNEFKSLMNLPQRLLGLPWYVGHPDHPRFKGQAGHTDTAAKGRIKQLEAREDGLYANVKFSSAGRQLLEDEAFHGHSVNWSAVPNGNEGGKQVFSPRGLKSVGFTNQPQIPVKPATLPNEVPGVVVPAKLKVLAGLKEDAEVSLDELTAALEKAMPVANEGHPLKIVIGSHVLELVLVNEAPEKVGQTVTAIVNDLQSARAALANERKGRATELVTRLVADGKILTAEKDAKITDLANAGDGYGALAAQWTALKPVVKTRPATGGLGGKNTELLTDVRGRQVKFDEMMAKRAVDFPNEEYEARYAAVANSPEGTALFAQMKRAGAEE